MRTVRTIAAVREHVGAARAGGRTIALVPTMAPSTRATRR